MSYFWRWFIVVAAFNACLQTEETEETCFRIKWNERKRSGDSRKAVYYVAAKSLDRAIFIHFSYDGLDTVAYKFHNYDFLHFPTQLKLGICHEIQW